MACFTDRSTAAAGEFQGKRCTAAFAACTAPQHAPLMGLQSHTRLVLVSQVKPPALLSTTASGNHFCRQVRWGMQDKSARLPKAQATLYGGLAPRARLMQLLQHAAAVGPQRARGQPHARLEPRQQPRQRLRVRLLHTHAPCQSAAVHDTMQHVTPKSKSVYLCRITF